MIPCAESLNAEAVCGCLRIRLTEKPYIGYGAEFEEVTAIHGWPSLFKKRGPREVSCFIRLPPRVLDFSVVVTL